MRRRHTPPPGSRGHRMGKYGSCQPLSHHEFKSGPVGCGEPLTRLPEMLSDRFGAFETVANSSIKLASVPPEEEMAMEPLVAEAVLEFGDDLRAAKAAVSTWARSQSGAE